MSEFDEYIVLYKLGQKEKPKAWQTMFGLHVLDALKGSAYLLETARQHIEGNNFVDKI